MDTLVDAGLAPDTSKWKYPPSSNVREIRWMTPCVCVFFLPASVQGGRGREKGGVIHASIKNNRESERAMKWL